MRNKLKFMLVVSALTISNMADAKSLVQGRSHTIRSGNFEARGCHVWLTTNVSNNIVVVQFASNSDARCISDGVFEFKCFNSMSLCTYERPWGNNEVLKIQMLDNQQLLVSHLWSDGSSTGTKMYPPEVDPVE